jgi:hypothetical protein
VSDYPSVPGPDLAEEPALSALVTQLRKRHRDAVCAVLMYGSCLRSGNLFDGLVDLYLICDDYDSAYGRSLLSLANRLLPPNVFYAEHVEENRTLRSKVTVISLADFRRGCSRGWFESYIWGRFSQPTRLLYARDSGTRGALEECLLNAVHTLLYNALPALPARGSLLELWEGALSLSYDTELRTERSGRAAELVEASAEFFRTVTNYHAGTLVFPFSVYDDDYVADVPARLRRAARAKWRLRRLQGKFFSILRLVKALFTFEGGLDYIAWKLERHSGEVIVVPDRVRRRPLIYMWGFFWGLYQRGVFK